MTRSTLVLMISTFGLFTAPAQAQTAAALKRQVFAAESSFAASMAERNFQNFARFVSREAVFFGDSSVMRGKEAVLARWRPFFEGAKAPFSWKPDVIEVLASGRLALSSGPVFDPAGQKTGTFSSIWRREPTGNWQIIFDKGCR